jgi:hypothetical protein
VCPRFLLDVKHFFKRRGIRGLLWPLHSPTSPRAADQINTSALGHCPQDLCPKVVLFQLPHIAWAREGIPKNQKDPCGVHWRQNISRKKGSSSLSAYPDSYVLGHFGVPFFIPCKIEMEPWFGLQVRHCTDRFPCSYSEASIGNRKTVGGSTFRKKRYSR